MARNRLFPAQLDGRCTRIRWIYSTMRAPIFNRGRRSVLNSALASAWPSGIAARTVCISQYAAVERRQAHLIGGRRMARRAIGRELSFMRLDQVLGLVFPGMRSLSALAVDALVETLRIAFERRHGVAHVDLLTHRMCVLRRRIGLHGRLDARDHASRPRPASGLMLESHGAARLRRIRQRMPEAQVIRRLGDAFIELAIAGEAEDIAAGGRHVRGELIDEGPRKTRRIRLRRSVLEAADGRLRGEGCARLRAAAGRHFQRRIVTQLIVVDRVFVAAADGEHACGNDPGHAMPDARRITPAGHRVREPLAHAGLFLRRPRQQQPGVRRLIAAVEIDCEFLGANGWQAEGKRRNAGHGRGARWLNAARRLDTGLPHDLNLLRHSRPIVAQA